MLGGVVKILKRPRVECLRRRVFPPKLFDECRSVRLEFPGRQRPLNECRDFLADDRAGESVSVRRYRALALEESAGPSVRRVDLQCEYRPLLCVSKALT